MANIAGTVTDICRERISHFRRKADHNKQEALSCFLLVIIATLLVPLFVTLGQGLWLGKIVPSFLSLIAAGATAWIQLRKPQQLWTVYRSAERDLEDNAMRHRFGIGEYATAEDPDKRLAEHIADISIAIHREWIKLVPSPEMLKTMLLERKAGNETPGANPVRAPRTAEQGDASRVMPREGGEGING